MRYVRQRHVYSCGAASLAMLTGIGYLSIMKMIQPKRNTKFEGTNLEKCLKVLHKLKIQYRISFNKRLLNSIKNNAYISVQNKNGGRHAVVWDAKNKKVLDPSEVTMPKTYIEKHINYVLEILE
jgi:ABC-type bacteriocin/lantibiotic exporter with double-glycine peptidase domain